MAKVCLYFQVHQPFRLKEYSFFKIGVDHSYEAVDQNVAILNRVSNNCYLPMNKLLKQLIELTDGQFKINLAITGTLLEQLEKYRPDVLQSFQELYYTGSVELLAETYYHSLASLYNEAEFARQVKLHEKILKRLFGAKPKVFRNTELIYSNHIGEQISALGYKNILTEGATRILGSRSPHEIYAGVAKGTKILLRDDVHSDDIAFRFGDPTWPFYPLLASTYAKWLHKYEKAKGPIILGMDYETFGEHRKVDTGIFEFMKYLPIEVLKHPDYQFSKLSDTITAGKKLDTFNVPDVLSWADAAKDTSAWLHDNMQKDALQKLYALAPYVQKADNSEVNAVWGKLQTSDHFYYMSARYWNDPVHRAFNPYRSPYDAYINFMNILSDFKKVIGV
jgi:alpha-amylase